MSTKLQDRIQALNERRNALLDELETLDAEDLEARPLPGKWSILEIVDHLVVAEREVFHGLPDASQLVERKRGLKARLVYSVVMMVLKYPIPVKIPSARMGPQGGRSLAELRREWDENQRWLHAYTGGLDRDGVAKAVFVHPVAGPMTVTLAVAMDQVHLDRHIRQIRRRQKLMG